MVELNLVFCKPTVSDYLYDLLRENHPPIISYRIYSVWYYSWLSLTLGSIVFVKPQGRDKLVVSPARRTSEIHNNSFLKFQKERVSEVSKKDRISTVSLKITICLT